MMNNSMLVLNIFRLIFSAYDLVETAISIQNELAKRLEEIINEMEKELQD
jgi:hypothetical protein